MARSMKRKKQWESKEKERRENFAYALSAAEVVNIYFASRFFKRRRSRLLYLLNNSALQPFLNSLPIFFMQMVL